MRKFENFIMPDKIRKGRRNLFFARLFFSSTHPPPSSFQKRRLKFHSKRFPLMTYAVLQIPNIASD